jgi:hypothetical protein
MQGSLVRRRLTGFCRRVFLFTVDLLVSNGLTWYLLPDHMVFYPVIVVTETIADPQLSEAELREWNGIVAELRQKPWP